MLVYCHPDKLLTAEAGHPEECNACTAKQEVMVTTMSSFQTAYESTRVFTAILCLASPAACAALCLFSI